MKTHFKGFLASVACAAFAMAFAPQARATAELKISDGTNTIDIVDNGTATCTGAVTGCADANPSVNVVTYIGTIGTWSLNVSTGSSHGASAGTDLDLNTVNSTSATSTLTIQFSDTGFPVSGSEEFKVGGTLQGTGTLTFNEYAGATKFSTTTPIGSTLTFSSSPFAGSTGGAYTGGGAFTEVAVLAFTGPGSTSFDAALTPVPEPTSVALFGGALLVIGSAFRRKLRRA